MNKSVQLGKANQLEKFTLIFGINFLTMKEDIFGNALILSFSKPSAYTDA